MFGIAEGSGPGARPRALLLCLLLPLSCFGPTLADTFCVDVERGRAGASGACAPGEDGFWSGPLDSLEEALSLAGRGDAVWIAAGVYREDRLLVPPGVRLTGGFAGSESSHRERDPWNARVFVRSVDLFLGGWMLDLLGDARIEDLTLIDDQLRKGVGLRLRCARGRPGGSVLLQDVIVRRFRVGFELELQSSAETQGCSVNLRVRDSVFYENKRGIWSPVRSAGYAEMTRHVEIERSVFHDNTDYGVNVEAAYVPAYVASTLEVRDSLFDQSVTGIVMRNLFGHSALRVRNLLGVDNEIAVSASSRSPFFDERGAPRRLDERDFSWDMELVGNTLVNNSLGLSFFQDDLVDEHEITHNYVVGNRGDGLLHGNASGGTRALVEDNWLIGNGGAGFHHAPHVCGVKHFRRNRISGNLRGLWSRDNGCDRFALGGRPEWRNDLSGNHESALAYDGLMPLAAEWNFWGSDDPAEIEAAIAPGSGPVDFVPWYWPSGGAHATGSPPFIEVYTRVRPPSALADADAGPEGMAGLAWVFDTSLSEESVAALEATLRWDPRLVELVSWSPATAGLSVSCELVEGEASLRCRAQSRDPRGLGGPLEAVYTRFRGKIPLDWTPHFDIEVQRLESGEGHDLLPIVMSHDDVAGWTL